MNRGNSVFVLCFSFLFAFVSVFGSENTLQFNNKLSESIRVLYWNNKTFSNEELCVKPGTTEVLDRAFAKNEIWILGNGWQRKFELQDGHGVVNTAPITIELSPTITQGRETKITFGSEKNK